MRHTGSITEKHTPYSPNAQDFSIDVPSRKTGIEHSARVPWSLTNPDHDDAEGVRACLLNGLDCVTLLRHLARGWQDAMHNRFRIRSRSAIQRRNTALQQHKASETLTQAQQKLGPISPNPLTRTESDGTQRPHKDIETVVWEKDKGGGRQGFAEGDYYPSATFFYTFTLFREQ